MSLDEIALEELGWGAGLEAALRGEGEGAWQPARVAEEQRGELRVLSRAGELRAGIAGRLRHHALGAEALPVVGDWVAVSIQADRARATIHRVLPRRSALVRKASSDWGRVTAGQVLAANLDHVFVVSSLNLDFNLRRLERYLALVWESGAQPVLLLSKSDLCREVGERRAQAEQVAVGVPIHPLSARSGDGLAALDPYLARGRTSALIGSSGVGKSTLVNRLLGRDALVTKEIRAWDDRGRHATSHRQLFRLPGGGLLIDTPGLREIGLWDDGGGVETAFPDVEALAVGCRFRDCSHASEPGCAVRAALADGRLSEARFQSYGSLQRELAHVARRRDQRARLAAKRARKRRSREIRDRPRRGSSP